MTEQATPTMPRVIAVEAGVVRRKRLLRGVTPARWVAAVMAAMVVQLPSDLGGDHGVGRAGQLLTLAGLVAGALAHRYVRRLRHGDARAARCVLAAVAGALVLGLFLVVTGPGASPRPAEELPFGYARGLATGLGEMWTRALHNPYTGQLDPAIRYSGPVLVALALNASTLSLRLKEHPWPLLRWRSVRWPLLLLLALVALQLLSTLVDALIDQGAPIEALAVIPVLLALVLAGRAAMEVLRPAPGDCPAPA